MRGYSASADWKLDSALPMRPARRDFQPASASSSAAWGVVMVLGRRLILGRALGIRGALGRVHDVLDDLGPGVLGGLGLAPTLALTARDLLEALLDGGRQLVAGVLEGFELVGAGVGILLGQGGQWLGRDQLRLGERALFGLALQREQLAGASCGRARAPGPDRGRRPAPARSSRVRRACRPARPSSGRRDASGSRRIRRGARSRDPGPP